MGAEVVVSEATGGEVRALVKAGQLVEALASAQGQVRAKPSDPGVRVQLFQLYAINGQWEKALDQLNIAMELNAKDYMVVAQVAGRALNAMAFRDEVFKGLREPKVLGEPEEWVGWMLQALKHDAKGEHGAAVALRERALEAAPAVAGKINGEAFAWLSDADQRFGPMIEIILEGGYYWAPVSRVSKLTIEPPEHLHYLVWTPATLRWSNGGEAIGMIPVRYPGSEASADVKVRLARATTWSEAAGRTSTGLGQRLLATDVGDYPMLDVRTIELEATGA
jgi:type VI secretion system protein ImpE